MHEYRFMQAILEAILARISENTSEVKVKEVALTVGAFEVHSEAAARQAFQVLAQGTVLENSRLTLAIIPPRCECWACGFANLVPWESRGQPDLLPVAECPRCGMPMRLTGGRGVEAIELVLADPAESV